MQTPNGLRLPPAAASRASSTPLCCAGPERQVPAQSELYFAGTWNPLPRVGTNVCADLPLTCFTLLRAYFSVANVLAFPLALRSAGRWTFSSLSVLISSLCVSALADCSLLRAEGGGQCPPRGCVAPVALPSRGALPCAVLCGRCPRGAASLAFPVQASRNRASCDNQKCPQTPVSWGEKNCLGLRTGALSRVRGEKHPQPGSSLRGRDLRGAGEASGVPCSLLSGPQRCTEPRGEEPRAMATTEHRRGFLRRGRERRAWEDPRDLQRGLRSKGDGGAGGAR